MKRAATIFGLCIVAGVILGGAPVIGKALATIGGLALIFLVVMVVNLALLVLDDHKGIDL